MARVTNLIKPPLDNVVSSIVVDIYVDEGEGANWLKIAAKKRRAWLEEDAREELEKSQRQSLEST